ncbi:MAG: hypothetical protein N4A31_04935 [Rickettsiales bacterium]|jgi:hypothetical protein|nr:hypothetical protein [Rickettsiales bacterium]
MIHKYQINGILLQCRDPEYYADDVGSFRIEPKGYCKSIEIIAKDIKQSLNHVTWLDAQYKCSPIYHNMEILKIGDCVNCDDPTFVELNVFLEEVVTKTSILHENIISKNYTIDHSQVLCNEILSSLPSIKEIILGDSEIMLDAFYIQRGSLESIFDSVLTIIGLPNQGIIGQFTKFHSYINSINRELSILNNLLPHDEY